MTGFDDDRELFQQEHFTIVEIDVPRMQTCDSSLEGAAGPFYTPNTCEQTWGITPNTEYETYYFATDNVPLDFGIPINFTVPAGTIEIYKPINPVIIGINEGATELRPGQGLAIQGSASITLQDFIADPGPFDPDDTSIGGTTSGTYMGKWNARNILQNREVRIKYFLKHKFQVDKRGFYTEDDAQVHYFTSRDFKNNGNGTWTLFCKDEMSRLDTDTAKFPPSWGNNVNVTMQDGVQDRDLGVDGLLEYWNTFFIPYVVKIGEEFMEVTAVGGVDNAVVLSVETRGADIIVDGNFITSTIKEPHDVGDWCQVCILNQFGTDGQGGDSDTTNIANFLALVLTLGTGLDTNDLPILEGIGGVDPARIPLITGIPFSWRDEVAEWHTETIMQTIWWEPESPNDVLKRVLNDYLMDMWYEPNTRLIRLSAISVWKTTDHDVSEGFGIDYKSLRLVGDDDMRLTRAYIYYNKRFKSRDDAIENFSSVSVNRDLNLERTANYGEPKAKQFDPSHVLGRNDADLLVQRTVQRFGATPINYTWITQEKYLDFVTGDIVNIQSDEVQGPGGAALLQRAQVLSIQPQFLNSGRQYKVKALSYETAQQTGGQFNITGTTNHVNLYTLAGAPSDGVDITFILGELVEGVPTPAFVGAVLPGVPAMTAGNFPPGSKVTIILTHGSEIEGLAGDGAAGGSGVFTVEPPEQWFPTGITAGKDGGVCFDALGTRVDIWLIGEAPAPGSTPANPTFITADGILKAPGGGGGASPAEVVSTNPNTGLQIGSSGGGGAGGNSGAGGPQGTASIEFSLLPDYSPPGNVGQAGGMRDGPTFNPPLPVQGVGGTGGGVNGNVGVAGNGGDWGMPGDVGTSGSNGGLSGSGIIDGGGTVRVFSDTVYPIPGRFINGNGDAPSELALPTNNMLYHIDNTSISGGGLSPMQWLGLFPGNDDFHLSSLLGIPYVPNAHEVVTDGPSQLQVGRFQPQPAAPVPGAGNAIQTQTGLGPPGGTSVDYMVLSFTNAPTGDEDIMFAPAGRGDIRVHRDLNGFIHMSGEVAGVNEIVSPFPINDTDMHLFTMEWNNDNTSKLTISGSGLATPNSNVGEVGGNQVYLLGVGGSSFYGTIGERVNYVSTAQDPQDRVEINEFLLEKWNLAP